MSRSYTATFSNGESITRSRREAVRAAAMELREQNELAFQILSPAGNVLESVVSIADWKYSLYMQKGNSWLGKKTAKRS